MDGIRLLIEGQMGKYKFPLVASTMLEKDLGMSGDDAGEFLEGYAKYFGVDLSGFRVDWYFFPEGSDLLGILPLLFPKTYVEPFKELTIGALVKGVRAGRLDEEVVGEAGKVRRRDWSEEN